MQPLRSLPTTPFLRAAALLPLLTAAAVATIAACGDTINNNGATCGAGTRLENGTCVAVTDATTPADAGVEDSGPADVGVPDTGPDPNAEDPTPDDPCPVSEGPRHYVFNCDPKCGAVDPLCDANFCTRDGTLRPIEQVETTAPSRFTLSAAVLSRTQIFTNPKTVADKVTIRIPRNAVIDLACVSPTAIPALDGGTPRTLPRFMMFLPMSWNLTVYCQTLDTGNGVASESRLVAQTARVVARGFDLQPSHSRRLNRINEGLHFDAMPPQGAGIFAVKSGCVKIDRKELIVDQWEPKYNGSRYRGFTGTYIYTDRKLAATNVEVELGYAKDSYSGDIERVVPNCP